MPHNFRCDQPNIYKQCDFQSPGNERNCQHMPLAWGKYCAYELKFINERRGDLNNIFLELLNSLFGASGRKEGCKLDPMILWYICFIYANDLKPVRQFHEVKGGCDKNRRAAFIARLISKHHPISYQGKYLPDAAISSARNTDGGQDYDPALRINERYAFHAFCHFLDLSPEIFEQEEMTKITSDLMFLFTHRDPQIESLVTIARLLSAIEANYQKIRAHEQEIEQLKKADNR